MIKLSTRILYIRKQHDAAGTKIGVAARFTLRVIHCPVIDRLQFTGRYGQLYERISEIAATGKPLAGQCGVEGAIGHRGEDVPLRIRGRTTAAVPECRLVPVGSEE